MKLNPRFRGFALCAALALLPGCASGGASPEAAGNQGPWIRMPKSGPGDWLYIHPEKDQTFEEFAASKTAAGRPARDARITIQPLGNVDTAHPELMASLSEFAGIFFGRPALVLPSLPIPEESFNPARSQYDAGRILSFLSSRAPAGACAFIGILERDLYLEGFAFLYGIGSLRKGIGVCSVARYNFEYIGMDPSCTLEKRSLKVACHEISHALGMKHCTRWLCLMNGANSIVEADRSPLNLCPDCRRKLQWLMGLDLDEWGGKLAAFYGARRGFEAEAEFLGKAIEFESANKKPRMDAN